MEENKIFFNAREWSICSDSSSSKGERTFVTDFEGGLSEAYCIGDKTQNVTEIGTKQLILDKNTKYTFYFWVKIDRSQRAEAVCQLQIVYNGDFENKRVYVLSNANIRPSKIVDGWQLYEIPFVTEENEYTQLRFLAKNAQCSIIPGREAVNYSGIKDDKPGSASGAAYNRQDEEAQETDEQNPFKNISDGFKEFFNQFDTQKTENSGTAKTNADKSNDPFAAFNDFARQVKRDVQREVNKSVRKDIYNDIKSMKDEIVNELKNTFNSDNNNNK